MILPMLIFVLYWSSLACDAVSLMINQGDDAAGPSALAHANLKRKVKERDQKSSARSCACGFVASFVEGYSLGNSKLRSCSFEFSETGWPRGGNICFAKDERFLWCAVAGCSLAIEPGWTLNRNEFRQL